MSDVCGLTAPFVMLVSGTELTIGWRPMEAVSQSQVWKQS